MCSCRQWQRYSNTGTFLGIDAGRHFSLLIVAWRGPTWEGRLRGEEMKCLVLFPWLTLERIVVLGAADCGDEQYANGKS